MVYGPDEKYADPPDSLVDDDWFEKRKLKFYGREEYERREKLHGNDKPRKLVNQEFDHADFYKDEGAMESY